MNSRLLFVGLLLLAMVPAAHAMRCGNELTHAGDYEAQVRARCGQPIWTEDHYTLESYGARDTRIEREVRYTTWFYNFGARKFMVRVVFRDGQLVDEENLGRGIDEVGTDCGLARFSRGISSGELVAFCGPPASRDVHPGLVSRRVAAGVHEVDENDREDWTYDFGGGVFYLLHLARGIVESVESLPR